MPNGIMGGENQLKIVLSLKDKASAKLKTFNQKFGAMAKKMVLLGAAAGAAVAAGIGVKAIKSAADFEKAMGNVATLVDTNVESMTEMGKKVKDISKRIPVDIGELTSALYDVRSAGISAADAMKVLESSGRLAVSGLGTTQEATNLLTSSMNVFAKQGYDSNEMANILFKTVKAGKTTVAELAMAFGMVAPIAGELGVDLAELQAGTAALTTTGMKASVAQSQLRAAMSNMMKPTKEMKELMDAVGVSTAKQLIETYGLVGGLGKLRDASKGNAEMFAKAMGSIEGLNAALFLTGEGAESFTGIMSDMEGGADSLTEAFDKQRQTTHAQFQTLKNELNVALIDLGVKILPLVIRAMNWAITTFRNMSEGIKTVKEWWDKWTDALSKNLILIDDLVKKARSFVNIMNKITATPFQAAGFMAGLSSTIKGRLGFQEGGIVPGPLGAPIPAIVHGGERIIPSGKGIGGITINITGNTLLDEQAAEKIGDMIIEKLKFQLRF